MPNVPRLVPDIPFPPYTFVPGKAPHPVSDPAGHSFGRAAGPVAPLEPDDWARCRSYLFGLDLFNHGYYWEAHETWETLWHACGRTGATADFLKALIKLAAAGVKHLEGRPKGVKSHAGRAAVLWQQVARAAGGEAEWFGGFRLKELVNVASDIAAGGWPAKAPMLIPGVPRKP